MITTATRDDNRHKVNNALRGHCFMVLFIPSALLLLLSSFCCVLRAAVGWQSVHDEDDETSLSNDLRDSVWRESLW